MRDHARSPPGEQNEVRLYIVRHTIPTPFTSDGGPLMIMRRTLAITAILLGLSTAAHAAILAAGSMYGGSTQNTAVCYLFNAGTWPVTFLSKQIFREGQPVVNLVLNFDSCGAVLARNSSCAIAVNNIAAGAAHGCKFVLSQTAAEVRGTFEARSGLVVLKNVELR